jgi:hypothetical protein
MLTEHERRRLGELELQLEADDPRLAGKFRAATADARPPTRLLVSALVGVAGFVVVVTGLAQTNADVAVSGLLLAGAGACIAAS